MSGIKTLNFRVEPIVRTMLSELSEDAGLTMTDYVVTLVRTMYRRKFPDRAQNCETAAERVERDVFAMGGRRKGLK
jgi:hypothetical protein